MLRKLVWIPLTLLVAMSRPAAQQDPLTVLREERAKFGAQIDTTQAGIILDATASRLGNGWGLLRKNGGNNCPQPGTGVMISCDWLVNRNTGRGCDSLGSGPDNENGGHTGPANPQWCPGEPFDTSAWVAPTGNVTNPPPPPPPPNTDIARLLAEMEMRLGAGFCANRQTAGSFGIYV